jgi:hypothetical protein
MALYVAICLLAALIAVPEGAHPHVTGIIWGVSLGLALAHWFAFRVSSRWVGGGDVRAADVRSGGAQVAGAAGVALLAYVGVLIAPPSIELEAVQGLLAGLIACSGFAVARGAGAGRVQSAVYAGAVLVVAVAIAVVKNYLAGH